MNDGPWYSEALLVSRLGVTRSGLEHERSRMRKDRDWQKKGREIGISQRALDKLLKKMGSPDLDCSDCLMRDDVTEPPTSLEFTVVRVFPNPRLLLGKNETAGEVRVRVSRNENFKIGMKLKAQPDPTMPGFYKIDGRCPRYPGRW